MSSTKVPLCDDTNLLDIKLLKRLFILSKKEQLAIKEYRDFMKQTKRRDSLEA